MQPFGAILESWFLFLARSYRLPCFRLLVDSQSKHRPFHSVKTRVRRIAANFPCDGAAAGRIRQACMARNKGV
jgi:hypothetical protein